MEKVHLWIWAPRSKVRNGWDFDTKEEAESYFSRHFQNEHLCYEITKEEHDKTT